MPGTFYNFDTHTLKFKSEKPGLKHRLRSVIAFISISLAIAILMVVCVFYFYGSPEMIMLQRKNAKLISEYKAFGKVFSKINSSLARTSIEDDSLYRVIVQAPPVDQSIREGGFGGADKYRSLESLDDADLVISMAKKLDILSKKADIQLKSYNDVLADAMLMEKKLMSVPSISPLAKSEIGYISDFFGYRIHPILKKRLFHWGVDMTANVGAKIYAPGDGVVEETGYDPHGYGRTLIINHGYGFETLYGHLSRFNVKKGEKVKRGDVIGFVGNTGLSSGPHLHYEIIKNGKKINPLNYFTPNMDPQEYFSIISR